MKGGPIGPTDYSLTTAFVRFSGAMMTLTCAQHDHVRVQAHPVKGNLMIVEFAGGAK